MQCSTEKSNNIKRTPARLGARTIPALGTTSAFKVAGVTMTALVEAAKGAERVKTNDGVETERNIQTSAVRDNSCVGF